MVLRALLCPGQGNDVLRRTYSSFHLAIPETTVSRPARADPAVFFRVGAIPVDAPRAIEDGATALSVDAWMKAPVLCITSSGSRVTYSWTQFLNTYANKWGGAHLDPLVPAHAQMMIATWRRGCLLATICSDQQASERGRLASKPFD